MAPNPKVKEAFRAMKGLEISEAKVKHVLKNLLQVYEKNWELIEAQNYRVLADAIFDVKIQRYNAEEQKKTEDEREREASPDEEIERPLKRYRRKRQDPQTSSDINNSKSDIPGTSLTKLKKDPNESPSRHHETRSQPQIATASPEAGNSIVISHPVAEKPLTRNKGKKPVSAKPTTLNERSDLSHNEGTHVSHSSSPHNGNLDSVSLPMRLRSRGKQTLNLPGVSGRKTKRDANSSSAGQIKDQKNDLIVPKEILPVSHSLIKPKDEPFTNELDEPIPICSVVPRSGTRSYCWEHTLLLDDYVSRPAGFYNASTLIQ